MNLEFTKDAELDLFMHTWVDTVLHMRDRPEDNHLRDLLLKQLRKSPMLKHQIEKWDEMGEDDPNKT